MNTITVYLGLGSNLGNKKNNILNSLSIMEEEIDIMSVSSLYRTEPWGFKEQPVFLNAACEAKTTLDPLDLLAYLKSIEIRFGRAQTFSNGPRILDIDILFYGNEVLNAPTLTIPHPRLSERMFVLAPLAEIAPALLHPTLEKTISELVFDIVTEEKVENIGLSPYPTKNTLGYEGNK